MPLFTTRQTESRDVTFPLRRGDRRYTTDLRFMARRLRLRRTVVVYEFAGIDHGERQLWRHFRQAGSWAKAADVVRAGRLRHPLTSEIPTEVVLEMPELLADAGN